MKTDILSKASKFSKKRKLSKRWQRVVTILAAIVVFCTTYALILPAITREANPTCGIDEHTHIESCYASKKILSCTLEEKKAHTHKNSCYETKPNLDALICDKEEHVHHEILCFIDPDAYKETMEEWEDTLPEELSGVWSQDLLLVAKSQLDYKESESNVQVDSNGTIRGYTRFGHWYGDPYGEWSSTFVAFCMNYAGIPHEFFPYESNSYRLYMELVHQDMFAKSTDEYTPQIGDVIFFDKTGNKNADHVGIVSSFDMNKGDSSASVITIEGDTEKNMVEYCSYTLNDTSIIGYGKLNKAYDNFKKTKVTKTHSGSNFTITAQYPQDALPDNTELVVRELNAKEYAEYKEIAKKTASSDHDITYIRLFDIKFKNNGIGIKPKLPVEINITYNNLPITANGKAKAITFSDRECEFLNTTGNKDSFTFRADYFDIAGTVFFEDDGFTVTTNAETIIAKTTSYNQSLFTEKNNFVIYAKSGSNYYAFDGNGNAVRITIDGSGNIICNTDNPDLLLWSLTYSSTDSYYIQNLSTGKYMHAFPNNGSGVTTSGRYPSTILTANGGVKIRSNSEYAQLNTSTGKFVMTQNSNNAAVYNFGITSRCTVWLDGTNGGLMSLGGSPDDGFTVDSGSTFTLPETWQPPIKYDYTLRGWYDIKNKRYYAPGSTVTVTDNLVFYADWEASTYDVGEFNTNVANTISTNSFINTHVFDYDILFDTMSESVSTSASAAGHSETWTLQTGSNSLDFIFRDYDISGQDISYPANCNARNTNGEVYLGLYNDRLADLLFNPDTSFDAETGNGVIGKTYIGTADHLFQIMHDPDDEHYGYHYYDSSLNAASYNQTDRRFYVYDYLERTTDSAKSSDEGAYSDFLPFNSPYANTNGKVVRTYNHNGTNNYMYDAKYNTEDNSVNNVTTNYLFGMSIEIDFYLPHDPGTLVAPNDYGNQDLYGQDMHFKFSGDDDVWVLVDGKLVLDIGGVHGIESGDINFSTGVVSLNGSRVATLDGITSGEHILTFYYLERGSSQSNCAIYFNVAPRFSFTLQKEDVLTRDLLEGAEFSFYEDEACTIPAKLWSSREAHDADEEPRSTFTIVDGQIHVWGMCVSKDYYIKETKPPDNPEYSLSHGIICVYLDKPGEETYDIQIIPCDHDHEPSLGYTFHDFKIDEEKLEAFIAITNARDYVTEVVSVQVEKKWKDNLDHTSEPVTVYLTYTDQNGTVHRIREMILNQSNDWGYIWTGLPKYFDDLVTEIQYNVEESYTPGYYGRVERFEDSTIIETTWAEAYSFENGKEYILRTANGYLSTTSESSATFKWVDEETAKTSPLALWTATVSSNVVKLINREGQIFTFSYTSRYGNNYYYSNKSAVNYQGLTFATATNGVIISYAPSTTRYYVSRTLNSNGYLATTTSSNSALVFTPMTCIEKEVQVIANYYYRVTNIPLDSETSLTVSKNWDIGNDGNVSMYEQLEVTVKLLANGVDTGRTVTLNLKNGWTDTFLGLPYIDADGNEISYSVVENWNTSDWIPRYGEIVVHNTSPPTYSTTITNTYRWGNEYELPETGGFGTYLYISGGLLLVATALFLLYKKRRKEVTMYLP